MAEAIFRCRGRSIKQTLQAAGRLERGTGHKRAVHRRLHHFHVFVQNQNHWISPQRAGRTDQSQSQSHQQNASQRSYANITENKGHDLRLVTSNLVALIATVNERGRFHTPAHSVTLEIGCCLPSTSPYLLVMKMVIDTKCFETPGSREGRRQ